MGSGWARVGIAVGGALLGGWILGPFLGAGLGMSAGFMAGSYLGNMILSQRPATAGWMRVELDLRRKIL